MLFGFKIGIIASTVTFGCLSLSITNALAAACTIAGGDIEFGVSSDVNSSTSIVSELLVTCVEGPPNGTLPYSIRINNGQNGNGTERRLRSPTNGGTIRYQLYRDAAYSAVWGDSASSAVTGSVRFNGAGFSTSTSGATRIRAKLNAQDLANAAVGIYSDTLVTSIEF